MLNDRNDPRHLNKPVLFLASWYPTENDPTHGIFIQNHARALARFTRIIVVYAYSVKETSINEIKIVSDGNLTELTLAYPKTNVAIPFAKQFSQFSNYVNAYKKLLQYLIDQHIDISAIQVNVVFPVAMILNIFKDHFKVPHTIAEHWSGYLPEDGNYKGSIVKHFTKTCFKNSSKVWYVSEKQKQALIAHGLKGNFELLYNAVDTDIFRITDAAKKKQKLTFLHVSSLVEREKNLKGTFEALKILRTKGYDFDVLVVGGHGADIKRTMLLQESVGFLSVNYTGYLDKEQIATYMNQCHALLLFSHFEGMPVVTLEALACGLPVFASTVGHLPYMISDEFGKLSPVNAIENFAMYLENFIQKKYSFNPQKMSQFISEHASYDAVGKQMFEFYSSR
jgi:glycosyltransferase involved in cell wall biosynthesis